MKNLAKYLFTALLAASIGFVGGADGDLNDITIGNYDQGYEQGYEDGYNKGFTKGYVRGYDEGAEEDNVSNNSSKNVSSSSSPQITATVYVTNTGSKYHKNGCQYLHSSKIAIDLNDAKRQGYDPCSKCY